MKRAKKKRFPGFVCSDRVIIMRVVWVVKAAGRCAGMRRAWTSDVAETCLESARYDARFSCNNRICPAEGWGRLPRDGYRSFCAPGADLRV